MTKCRACGKQARVTTIALVLGGRLKGGRVCKACATDGVVVVSPKLAPIAPVKDVTKAERKEQREVLAPFIQSFVGRVRMMKATPGFQKTEREAAIIETLENVISQLKEGRT